jgi:hypothetical protein
MTKNMTIGNPYKFAILADDIKEWSDTCWRNGVFFFCIDGELFPKEILNVTFNSEVWQLTEIFQKILIKPFINKKLFDMEKEKALVEMFRIFPIEWNMDDDNNQYYYISPQVLADFDYYTFMVSNGEQIRIMAAKVNFIKDEGEYDLNNLEISEAFITNGELEEIFRVLSFFLSKSGIE